MAPKRSLPTIDDCHGCGVCCMHMGYPPYLRGENGGAVEPAWESMAAPLKQSLLEFMQAYENAGDEIVRGDQLDGPCVWFDLETKRCRHHESRPKVCRDFRVGSRGCQDWRAAYGID